MGGTAIGRFPIHLGLGARAVPQPAFTGSMEWYADYVARNADDGREGRQVTTHRFTESWDSWEVHPEGDEVVLCLSGTICLLQELADGPPAQVTLGPGDFAINPPGVWHTADIADEACVLFITAGWETRHRPR